jgi:hypothetical protein
LGGVFVQHRKSTRSLLIENDPGYAKIIERRLIFLQDLQEAFGGLKRETRYELVANFS